MSSTHSLNMLLVRYYKLLMESDYIQNEYLQTGGFEGAHFFKSQIPVRKKDTLCILAGGPSLNQITDAQLDFIKNSDSLGLNWFYLHDYIPDFYQIEVKPQNRDFLYEFTNFRAKGQIIPSVGIYDVESLSCDFDFKKVPFENTYFCSPIRFRTFEYEELREICFHQGQVGQSLFSSVVFHNGGGLSQAVSFGLMLRYKRIVLFGVDLNKSGHFFDVKKPGMESFYERARKIRDEWQAHIRSHVISDPTIENLVHPSESAKVTEYNMELPVTQAIACMLEWAKSMGTKIEIANSDAMAGTLPRFIG